MSWHIWLLKPYYDFWATMYSFCFSLFLLILISSWVQIKMLLLLFCSSHYSKSEQVDILQMLTFWTCYVNWSCEVIQYTCDRVVESSKNSPSTLWCHMSVELFTCSWFFNKILQNQLPTHRAALNTSTLCDHLVGNIVYTSMTDSYDDLMWLYLYFL